MEGEHGAGVAEICVCLGAIKEKQHLYDEARSHYDDALKIYNVLYEEESPHEDVAQILTSIAIVLKAQKKYDLAKSFYERAWHMRRLLHPDGPHPDIAQSMNNLAGSYSYSVVYGTLHMYCVCMFVYVFI